MEGVIYHVYHSHDSLDKRANMTQQIPEEKMNRKLVYTNYLHFFIFIDNKRLLVSIASITKDQNPLYYQRILYLGKNFIQYRINYF